MERDLRFVQYFLYTQQSLGTFEKCPLKFKKKYIEGLKWDSFSSPEVKEQIEKGNLFHLMANRYFLGVETGEEYIDEASEIRVWIANLRKSFKLSEDARMLPEHKLRLINGDMRLEANFDLISYQNGKLSIWDWKTHSDNDSSKKNIRAKTYQQSLQTKIYLFVIKELSHLVAGHEVMAKDIGMTYWQPNPPQAIVQIPYSDKLHEEFRHEIEQKIQTVKEYDYRTFDKARYIKSCRFCEFNWFCNNDKVSFEDIEEEVQVDEISWDDVEEMF